MEPTERLDDLAQRLEHLLEAAGPGTDLTDALGLARDLADRLKAGRTRANRAGRPLGLE